MTGAAARETSRGERFERAAREADACLSQVADGLEFLLHVTPVNLEGAWREFAASGYARAPAFEYRPLPYDPAERKRRALEAPVDDVADPTVSELLREKQEELDVKLSMLRHRGSPRFLQESLRIYGGAEEELAELAERILFRLPVVENVEPVAGRLDAAAFAARAERELDHYRRLASDFDGCVVVSDDALPGLMVSGDRLLVGSGTHVPRRRAAALLQHEVGTHLVTRYNGCRQPLRLLASGLAGYDVLQEGLAVVAEYLVGGLNRSRFRILAARVLAVRCLTSGADFNEAFHLLEDRYGLAEATAFNVTARVFRAGGLTKDAVYLRGLVALLDYLTTGGAAEEPDLLEPLLVGKVDLPHVPSIRELLDRGLLEPPVLTPRFLGMEEARDRLQILRAGATPLDLLKEISP